MTVVDARDMCESFLLILVLPVFIYCFEYRNLPPLFDFCYSTYNPVLVLDSSLGYGLHTSPTFRSAFTFAFSVETHSLLSEYSHKH